MSSKINFSSSRKRICHVCGCNIKGKPGYYISCYKIFVCGVPCGTKGAHMMCRMKCSYCGNQCESESIYGNSIDKYVCMRCKRMHLPKANIPLIGWLQDEAVQEWPIE